MSRSVRLRGILPAALGLSLLLASTQATAARLELVTSGLNLPLLVAAPAGDPRLFVVERGGRIRLIVAGVLRPEPFLDISDRTDTEREGGLTGLVFPPDFATTGRFLVYYQNGVPNLEDRIMESRVSAFYAIGPPATAVTADAEDEEVLFSLEQPNTIHNGSTIAIRGSWLYLAVGDGGGEPPQVDGGYDPDDEAQRGGSPFGKILRLDLAIPDPDNGDWQVWATGFRNPFRFSFDRLTGDLYLGDVGQDSFEEIDVQPANAAAGANFGWDVLEALQPVDPDPDGGPDPGEPEATDPTLVPPVYAYAHAPTGCGGSVTGGFVYRGTQVPELQGQYVFADYCRDRISTLRWTAAQGLVGPVVDRTDEWMPAVPLSRIAGFGEDAAGELYVTSFQNFGATSGCVHKVPEAGPSGALAAAGLLAWWACRRERAR
jgi:glucose/arabinose dehydrogenase